MLSNIPLFGLERILFDITMRVNNQRLVHQLLFKMSLKAPFRSYKSTDDRDWPIWCSLLDAESTGFGPKRLRCSVPPLFPIEHG